MAAKSLCLYWTSILCCTKIEPCSDVMVSEIHSCHSVLRFSALDYRIQLKSTNNEMLIVIRHF